MAEALKCLPQTAHPDLLVGFNKSDDAGVFRLNDRQALIQTVDFFPPIVDDPYFFGQIAAANALSDVFAMGGRPLTALNIIGFPVASMPREVFTEILRGGSDKIEEAGAIVVGGHSIKDKELKYGVAVSGIVNPDKIITNAGAKPGDLIFLTKPLGTGIVTTGIKRGAVNRELSEYIVNLMAMLNETASRLMTEHDAHAATDVTGFGLLGHAFEIAKASDVRIRLFADAIPVIPEALTLAAQGMNPGGANDNRDFLKGHLDVADSVNKNLEQVLFDPQTSGGMLIVIAANRAEVFQQALRQHDLPYEIVGEVLPRRTDRTLVIESGYANQTPEKT